jgi:peptidoglycan/xylan/chitin deacetylase (PgdA/CDA1 family)
MDITTIGFDLAKTVFQVHGADGEGRPVLRRKLRRGKVLAFFAGLPSCLVGMEACASTHYWARELQALGHKVQLIPPHYDSDAYNDNLPYWVTVAGKAHLVVPYTLDNNDGRLSAGGDFALAEDFFTYLRDAFDWLYDLGKHAPRMMSIGLHCRIIGRPGRIGGLARFLDYVQEQNDVWICRRIDIARHWHTQHPYSVPPTTSKDHPRSSR